MGGGTKVDRTPFTDFMNKVDGMSDSQLTMLYVYTRDVRQLRAQERAMARRQLQNAPTPRPEAPSKGVA